MNKAANNKNFDQIMWDYSISGKDAEKVFSGELEFVGHYNQATLFRKIIETYSWYTILKIFPIEKIRELLTDDVVKGLRMPSLQKQYEFVQKRLQEIIPTAG